MTLSEAQTLLARTFFPRDFSAREKVAAENGRFVHYTSAEAALKILVSQEVWLRNVSTMNDFMEVEHGWGMLIDFYRSNEGARFKAVLNKHHPGVAEDIAGRFESWMPRFKTDTYVICLSEHDTSEDKFGRLSMWRAYGRQAGVALVLNNTPFMAETDKLNAYSSPIAYLDRDQFFEEFGRIVDALEAGKVPLDELSRDEVLNTVFWMHRFVVLCTKHKGFEEEREWRIVYSPSFALSPAIEPSIETVNGIPQLVQKLPLRDDPEKGLYGADIQNLLDRVIIGPTEHGLVTRDAFVRQLCALGVSDAAERVIISDIPLRT